MSGGGDYYSSTIALMPLSIEADMMCGTEVWQPFGAC